MNFSRTLVFLRSKISWSPYVQKLNGTNKEVLGILNYKGRRSFLVLALLFYKHNGYGFNINSIKKTLSIRFYQHFDVRFKKYYLHVDYKATTLYYQIRLLLSLTSCDKASCFW